MKYLLSVIFSLLVSAFLTFTSFFISGFLNKTQCCDKLITNGWPLPFYYSGGFTGASGIYWTNLFLDLLFWFLLSLAITLFLFRIRSKLVTKEIALVGIVVLGLLLSGGVVIWSLTSLGYLPKLNPPFKKTTTTNQSNSQSLKAKVLKQSQLYSDFKEGVSIPVEGKVIFVKRYDGEGLPEFGTVSYLLLAEDSKTSELNILRGFNLGMNNFIQAFYIGGGKVLVFYTTKVISVDMANGRTQEIWVVKGNDSLWGPVVSDNNNRIFAFNAQVTEENGGTINKIDKLFYLTTIGREPMVVVDNSNQTAAAFGFSKDEKKLIYYITGKDQTEYSPYSTKLVVSDLETRQQKVLSSDLGKTIGNNEKTMFAFTEGIITRNSCPDLAKTLKLYNFSLDKVVPLENQTSSNPDSFWQISGWGQLGSQELLAYKEYKITSDCAHNPERTDILKTPLVKLFNPQTLQTTVLKSTEELSSTNSLPNNPYPFVGKNDTLVYPNNNFGESLTIFKVVPTTVRHLLN